MLMTVDQMLISLEYNISLLYSLNLFTYSHIAAAYTYIYTLPTAFINGYPFEKNYMTNNFQLM